MTIKIRDFLKREDGAVTVDWVALTAAVLVVTIGVVFALQTDLDSAVADIGDSITIIGAAAETDATTETTN